MYMHAVVSVLRDNKGQNNLTKGDIDKHRIYIRNLVNIFCRLSTMHERDKQTGHGTVVSIAVAKSLSAMSPNNNKYINLYSAKLPVFRCVGVKCFQFPVNVRYAENTSCSYSTLSLHFYRAMHFSAKRGIAIACRLSVCLSVCNVGEL